MSSASAARSRPPPRPAPATDTTAPSVPTGLDRGPAPRRPRFRCPGRRRPTTSAGEVAGYEVYRGTTLVGTTTTTSLHRDRPERRDRVLVHGPRQGRRRQRLGSSAAVSATTQTGTVTDTTAPTAPTGLTAGTTTTTGRSRCPGPRPPTTSGRHRLRRLPRHHPGGHDHLDELHRDTACRPRPRTRSRSVPRTPQATCPPPSSCRLGHHADRFLHGCVLGGVTRRPAGTTGFTASVKVTNTGTTALSSWSARLLLRQRPEGHPGLERRLVPVRHRRHGQERRLERHPRCRPGDRHRLQRLPHGDQQQPDGVHAERRHLHHRLVALTNGPVLPARAGPFGVAGGRADPTTRSWVGRLSRSRPEP